MTRGGVDLRLVAPATTAWAAAASTVTAPPRMTAYVAIAAGCVAVVAGSRRRWWSCVIALGIAAGCASTAAHVESLTVGAVAAAARHGDNVDVVMRLVRDPLQVHTKTGHRLVVVDATVTQLRLSGADWVGDRAPVVVFALDPQWFGLLPGQTVATSGRLTTPRGGDFVAAALLADGPPTLRGRPPVWQRAAATVRAGLRRACVHLPADERGLLPGLVLGDVALMPSSLVTAFRVTGLTHLTAVSGANVAVVLMAVGVVLSSVGLGRRTRAVVSGIALLAFVVLVRPSPSVLRAAVMGVVALAATMTGRPTRALPALAGAVLALVLIDPFLARSPGFAMSVLATAAIVTVAPAWTKRLSARMPRPVAAAIAVPAAAQLACTPVIVGAFGQLTPYAVIANLLAAPAVAPATLLGVGAAVVAVVSAPIAGALAWLGGLPVAWLVLVARSVSRLPFAAATWATGWRGDLRLALVAGVGIGLVAAGRRRRRRAILGPWPP